jgi:hypothetical protein
VDSEDGVLRIPSVGYLVVSRWKKKCLFSEYVYFVYKDMMLSCILYLVFLDDVPTSY